MKLANVGFVSYAYCSEILLSEANVDISADLLNYYQGFKREKQKRLKSSFLIFDSI